jgi:diamine N-acetyltransferase
MIIEIKNHKQVRLRKLIFSDFDKLLNYLEHLTSETKSRFGPHPFDKNSIVEFYKNPSHIGYVVEDTETTDLVAYSIVKIGYLEHDSMRLQSYGLALDNKTDCTFAPSVADQWQSSGLGNALFQFILTDLKNMQVKRIILWGGVQMNNDKAVNYYKRNGFEIKGQFYYNGENYDMTFQV